MAVHGDVNCVTLNGGFASLATDIIHGKHSEEGPDRLINNSQLSIDINVNKGLPAAGLKRNTKQWQGKEPERNDNGGDSQTRGNSQSSASSLLPVFESRNDSKGISQGGKDQGAEGRGSGQHEELILDSTDNHVTESPVEGHGGYLSIAAAKDLADPLRTIRIDDFTKGSNEEQFAGQPVSRSSNVEKQFPDEIWRLAYQRQGMKSEDKPGPMNGIFLEPRIPHIHVNLFSTLDFLLC